MLWLQPGHFFCYRLAASVGARIAAASGPGTKLLEKSRGQVSNLRRREQEKLRRQVSNLRWRLFGPPERPNNFPNPEQTSDPQTGRPVATPSFRVGGRESLTIAPPSAVRRRSRAAPARAAARENSSPTWEFLACRVIRSRRVLSLVKTAR